jgi:hypothetical protein
LGTDVRFGMSPRTKDPFEAFKPIRNLLGKYDTVSLAVEAATKLHEVEVRSIQEWRTWCPWLLLLLIKWGFEFGGSQFPSKAVGEDDLANLINKLHDFERDCGSPFLGEQGVRGLPKFLRTTAFQQFWMQRSQAAWDLARQRALFCHLRPGHPLQAQFTRRFGLTMEEFIEFALLVWAWLAKTPANVQFTPKSLFASLNVPADKQAAFISALCLQPKDVGQFLRDRPQAVKNHCFQLREPSPLDQYPFLALEGKQLVYSRRLFERTTRHFFYDQAKLLGKSKGAELVAQILEQHVGQSLGSVGLPFYTESDLKHAFPSRKVTDFLVPRDDMTVLVEVKAGEMRPSVIVYPANEQLVRELQDSVIKAAVQGYSLAHDLNISSAGLDIPNRSDFFLFILTYRDMYLGPGKLLWEEFLAEAVQTDLEHADIDPQIIPPERIVVLSLDEWDTLMSILLPDPTLLSRILNGMVVNNRSPLTAKFALWQHLDPYIPAQPELPYLDEEADRLFASLQAKMSS